MDEYQHMERFDMENDYVGGQWVDGEFYYKKRKEKKNQTRDEALYGVFDDSNSSDDDSSRRRKRRDVVKTTDYLKGVNFVSTGTFQPSEKIPQEEVAEERPGIGSHRAAGLGYAGGDGEAAEDEVEEELFPSAFGKKIKEDAERKEKERKEKREREKARSKGLSNASSLSNPDIAVFEKHTKGIGFKLLEKMGYKGGGLGKNAQGIAVPIQAELRPNKIGLGYGNNALGAVASDLPASLPREELEEKAKDSKPKEKLWHKKNASRRRNLKTADDLLLMKSEQGAEPVQMTILDMRGSQVRVLTNLEHINAEHADVEDDTPMPELQHNIRLIIDLVEADIQNFARKLKHEEDTCAILKKEQVRLKGEVDRQNLQITTLECIKSEIENVKQQITSGNINLDALAATFTALQKDYMEEYKMHNISSIALSLALPLMVKIFQGWNPLSEPMRGRDVIGLWQQLLQADDPRDYAIFPDATNSPYVQLLMEAVFPALRFATTNMWEPREPETMLKFLDAWDKLLPESVRYSVLEHLVLPKLTMAVDIWDPRKETVPIHVWIHPWLLLLGSRLEPLYQTIRFKLGDALRAWHPSDSSALQLLSPWQAVFDPGSWEQLIVRSIIPKLMGALNELVINPQSQQLQQFNWVMSWAQAIPIHHMASMLEAIFFPKWLQVLYHWLCATPDYEEVTRWYLGWKQQFTAELLANERIRHQLQIALDMMDKAVEGMPIVQPGARENISYLRVTEQRQFESQQQAAYSQRQASGYGGVGRENGTGATEMTLKEVVETFAEQSDVLFLPKAGRMHEGLQIYGFGSINICMDNAHQRLYAQTGDRWILVSLEQVLEMHRAQSGRWK